MSKMSELHAKAELAMMGFVVECNTNEAKVMSDYIADVLTNGLHERIDLSRRINQYNRSRTKNEVVGMVCSKAYNMPMIHFILKNDSKGDYKIVPFEYKSGQYEYSFCWTENLSDDNCSELGDMCFKNRSGIRTLASIEDSIFA